MSARILVVDDEARLRALLSEALTAEGWETVQAGSAEEAWDRLANGSFEVVITDVRLPGESGLDLIKRIKGSAAGSECIVITAYAESGAGVEAMRRGAFEYLLKPFEMDEVVLLVRSALEKGQLRDQLDELRHLEGERHRLERVVGRSKAMQGVVRQARMVARRDTTILIRGKSGTGKELIARGIHAESGRDPFLAVNCGAVPESLLESELFGHEKGAFTGAIGQKQGYFERAGNGTIFLDEIGDVTPAMQVKLLRVLQEHEFTRVGGSQLLRTSARVIAATHRNLEDEVRDGNFREDLYFRLNVFPIYVPSLSEHLEDMPLLCDAFLKKFNHSAGLGEGVLTRFLEYSWPGNVRELENCLERAAIIAGTRAIAVKDLPEHIREKRVLERPTAFKLPETGLSLDELEKNLILQALERTVGNKTKAALLLGITRRALYSRMHTHGIRGYWASEEGAASES